MAFEWETDIHERIKEFGATMTQLLHEEPSVSRAVKAYASLPENTSQMPPDSLVTFIGIVLTLHRMGKENTWEWVDVVRQSFAEWEKEFQKLEEKYGGPIE